MWFNLIRFFAYGLCAIPIILSTFFTVVSIIGMIKATTNKLFWQFLVILMLLIIFTAFFISIIEYLLVYMMDQYTLQQIYTHTVNNLNRSISILSNAIGFLKVLLLFDLGLALIIWGGDGHGLSGTWRFTAGQIPMVTCFLSIIPLIVQRKTHALIYKKLQIGGGNK